MHKAGFPLRKPLLVEKVGHRHTLMRLLEDASGPCGLASVASGTPRRREHLRELSVYRRMALAFELVDDRVWRPALIQESTKHICTAPMSMVFTRPSK